jgi:hypothetical protein
MIEIHQHGGDTLIVRGTDHEAIRAAQSWCNLHIDGKGVFVTIAYGAAVHILQTEYSVALGNGQTDDPPWDRARSPGMEWGIGLDQPTAYGIHSRLSSVGDAKLVKDILDVGLDGGRAEDERFGDFLVGLALSNEA